MQRLVTRKLIPVKATLIPETITPKKGYPRQKQCSSPRRLLGVLRKNLLTVALILH